MRDIINLVESRVDELFDSSTGIEWEDNFNARFSVAGEQYVARFIRDAGGSNFFHFLFFAEHPDETAPEGVKGRIDNTGKVGTQSVKVFGKALECLQTFITERHPFGVEFIGKIATGRDNLYVKMARFLEARLSKLGYNLEIKDQRGFNDDRTAFEVNAKRFTLLRPKSVQEDYEDTMTEDLRATKTKDIDVDDAIRHFDLPVDMSRADMKRAFAATKQQFLDMIGSAKTLTIYRGLQVEAGWKPRDGLGRSWAFGEYGAMKGSGLSYWKPTHEDDLGVLMVGEVSINDIDWLTTIAVNAFHEDEMEIVVNEGAHVLVKEVKQADRTGIHGAFMTPNQTFTA